MTPQTVVRWRGLSKVGPLVVGPVVERHAASIPAGPSGPTAA
jgi:hypothetical protein